MRRPAIAISLGIVVVAATAGGCRCASRGGDCAVGGGPRAVVDGNDAVIHYVRIRSSLPDEQVMTTLQERAVRFREVPGLVQKFYGRDAATGEYCGIYIFESPEAHEAFTRSELARTIREAYAVESARIEQYEMLWTLWPGVRGE